MRTVMVLMKSDIIDIFNKYYSQIFLGKCLKRLAEQVLLFKFYS